VRPYRQYTEGEETSPQSYLFSKESKNDMKTIEKTGKTVDQAIALALEELGLERDEVQVDILQIESAGILGMFGKREARVRVTPIRSIKTGESVESKGGPKSTLATPPQTRVSEEPVKSKKPIPEVIRRREIPSARRRDFPKVAPAEPTPKSAPAPKPIPVSKPVTVSPPVINQEVSTDSMAARAAEVLTRIAEAFRLNVRVDVDEDPRSINLRVGGEDVGQLIGRRGRTLGAVQYILSRIINEDQPNKKKINIDVDGYNESREKSVSEMASRAVERVLQNGRPYTFRPMSPQERRMIHVNLQDHPDVGTQSVGEEPNRFVVIYPRNMTPEELERYLTGAIENQERRPRGNQWESSDHSRPRGRGRDQGRGSFRGQRNSRDGNSRRSRPTNE
jgi:spoIIIJ-associated protein